jgi:hypothetical protein
VNSLTRRLLEFGWAESLAVAEILKLYISCAARDESEFDTHTNNLSLSHLDWKTMVNAVSVWQGLLPMVTGFRIAPIPCM